MHKRMGACPESPRLLSTRCTCFDWRSVCVTLSQAMQTDGGVQKKKKKGIKIRKHGTLTAPLQAWRVQPPRPYWAVYRRGTFSSLRLQL